MANRLEKQVKCRKKYQYISFWIHRFCGWIMPMLFPSLHKIKGSDWCTTGKVQCGNFMKERGILKKIQETWFEEERLMNELRFSYNTCQKVTSFKQAYFVHCSVLTAHSPSLVLGNYSFSHKATSYLYTQLSYMFTNVTKHKLYSCFNYR